MSEQPNEFMLTTVLHFADHSREGQIFCVGTKEACEKMQDFIPAIMYNGDKKVLSSGTIIVPLDVARQRPRVGEYWKIEEASKP